MSQEDSKRIIILGGGTAGWVSAAVFAAVKDVESHSVTVVDTAQIQTIGVGEASIPTLYEMLEFVGISDRDLIAKADATFKYGIEFENWSKQGEKYMHGFGNMGKNLNDFQFFQVWLRSAKYFTSRDLTSFTPSIVAAYANKFSRIVSRPKGDDGKLYYPLSELSYALHFDAALLAQLLKQKAIKNGVKHLARHVVDVECDEEGVSALITEDGERLQADLFIDCSGMSGVISRKTLGG